MKINELNEAKKVWQLISKEKPNADVAFEVQLANFFQYKTHRFCQLFSV